MIPQDACAIECVISFKDRGGLSRAAGENGLEMRYPEWAEHFAEAGDEARMWRLVANSCRGLCETDRRANSPAEESFAVVFPDESYLDDTTEVDLVVERANEENGSHRYLVRVRVGAGARRYDE